MYKKGARKMLMKLTPGINFTNILLVAFIRKDPKSKKNTAKLLVSFVLWDLFA